MLTTQRIEFKYLQKEHLEALEKLLCQNERVMKLALKGRVFTKEEFEAYVQDDFCHSEEEKAGFLCVTFKGSNEVIGISGLLRCNYLDQDSYEFGFILHEAYWGRGLATEIGAFWLQYAKEQMGLGELLAVASPQNKASIKVLEKLQMKLVRQIESKERGKRLVFMKQL